MCLAPASVIWAAPKWLVAESFEANLSSACSALNSFARVSERLELDGYVLELPVAFGETVRELANTTNRVLRFLGKNDPFGADPFSNDPNTGDWHFVFAAQRFYILAFGKCYPPDHARHIFDTDATFLLFQPHHAFVRRRSPPGALVIAEEIKVKIRHAYATAGRPYDPEVSRNPIDALKFVKPLRLSDALVEWWKLPL